MNIHVPKRAQAFFWFSCITTCLSLTSMHNQRKNLICTSCLEALAETTKPLHHVEFPHEHTKNISQWAAAQAECNDCMLYPQQKRLFLEDCRNCIIQEGYMIQKTNDITLQNCIVYFMLSCTCISMLYYKTYPDIRHCLMVGTVLGVPLFFKALYEILTTNHRYS